MGVPQVFGEKLHEQSFLYVYDALTFPLDGKIATIPGILGVCSQPSSDFRINPTPDSDRQGIFISLT